MENIKYSDLTEKYYFVKDKTKVDITDDIKIIVEFEVSKKTGKKLSDLKTKH